MARITIRKMERIEKARNHIHDEVHSSYTSFEIDGNKYVQIDTYGSIYRENPEKVSQSLQIDRESAEVIVKYLKSEFNI